MAGAFSVGDEADEQHIGIGAVGWGGTELVPPQPKRLPGSHLSCDQADHVGVLARLRDELEVDEPYLLERQFSRCHERPTS